MLGLIARLLTDLQPEFQCTAAYLYNRILRALRLSPDNVQKTPIQGLYNWLQDYNYDITGIDKPDLVYLKAYGCRAYLLTTKALISKKKRDLKTELYTEIGYLVGYEGSNIYRVWVLYNNEVRRVRNVTFDESLFFNLRTLSTSNLLRNNLSCLELSIFRSVIIKIS